MGYLVEKVAYLRGLAEGMKIDEKTNEGKMIGKILEVLEELSANFEDLSDEVLEGEARIDELEECFDELCEELDEGCDCDCCGGDDDDDDDFFDELDDEDFDDVDFYETVCTHCGEKIYFDEDMIEDDGLICPNCDKEIKFDLDGCDCGCDCGCED
ncbi:MAG: zinc ribbon domain-containing protein [Clostridia bacterium]|nr:zinc ribbon domain-containing protein [Clostridia bacterium]MBQ3553617.1 zinc ribbon domain-containing protein [Clostridia bacterium]